MRKYCLCCTLLLALLAGKRGNTQDLSNKGKEFWLCFPSHVPSSGLANMALFITSDRNSKGTITVNGFTASFNVIANQIAGPYGIPYANAYISDAESFSVVNKGIHVEVDPGQPPVVVFAHIYAGFRSEASLILPVATLGKKYFSTNFYQLSTGNSKSQFEVIATEANTVVQYQLRRNGVLDPLVMTATLNNPGDVLQIQDNQDLSGSVIESIASASGSCKRIAVFSGSSSVAIGRSGCNPTSYDPLYQQCYPVNSWGKNFGIVPLANNSNGYHIRVVASENNTTVNVNGTNVLLNQGEYYPATSPGPIPYTGPMTVSSDKPISVAQYLMSANCSGSMPILGNPQAQGDPEMIILNPVEQSISDINIFSSNLQVIRTKYLCVYMKSNVSSTFRINGAPPSAAFVPMPSGNGYSYLVEDLTPYATQSFRLTADSGFNAITYGMGDAESYGYSAGTNVKDFSQHISVSNQFATVDLPVACKGAPFSFSMTFPYQPTQIIWQFNGLFPDVTQNSPVFTSTSVVNGKTVYKYDLPGIYSIPAAGTYPIRIVAQNPTPDGCNGVQEIDYDMTVYDLPAADFNFAITGCGTAPVNFTDNTTNTGGRPITHWHWNFGDGNVANDVTSVSHTFPAPGPYDVKYTVITDYGCKADTTIHQVVIATTPQANFTASAPYCAGKTVTFTDNSNGNGGTIIKWHWDFGDGQTLVATTGAAQTHTYAGTGPYTVTLRVETSANCMSLFYSLPITVSPNPVVSFSLPNVCLPVGTAQFNSTSTISDGSQGLFTYTWNFGDGSPNVGGQNPVHNYATPGPFNVKLVVTSNNGCKDSLTQPLNTVYAEPQAAFTPPAEVCVGAAINFQDQSTAPGSTVSQWTWNFGDGSPVVNTQNPSHTFITPGTYTVTLSVGSAAGCQTVSPANIASHTIIVRALPTANFTTALPGCVGSGITFTDNSNPNGGTISQWTWNFGDGPPITVSTNASQTHSFATSGLHTISLIVTTSIGCASTAFLQQITVSPKPVVNFSLPNVCLPMGTAQFNSTSTISDGTENLFTYLWNFGDGSPTVGGQNPVHNYTATGPYDVKLVITSNNGCKDSLTRSINTIYAEPQAAFNAAAEVCVGTAVNFQDQSSAPGSSITQWVWDFGDGSPLVNTQNPSHNYAAPGSYTVTLRATSAVGCQTVTASHIATRPVVVNALPTPNFNITLPGCVGQGVTFTDISVPNSGTIVKWTWNFGDATNAVLTSGAPFVHTYSAVNTYNVTLQVETDKGCINTITPPRNVVINAVPVAEFTPPTVCVNDVNAQFNDISTGNVAAWEWNFGDANANAGNPNTSTLQNPTHHYTQPGPYTAQLIVTNNAGCKDTIPHNFTVNGGILNPVFSIENTGALCSDQSITIKDASTIDFGRILRTEITWEPGNLVTDNNPSTGKTYSHTYPEFGTPAFIDYNVTYTVYSGQSCFNTSTQTIRMLATPQLASGAALPVCTNSPSFQISQVQLTNALPGAGTFSGPGVSSTGLFNPQTAGAGTHSITYTYNANNGCSKSISQAVIVNPTPVADAGPTKGVLEGGYVVLTPVLVTNMPVTYSWSPPTYLNNPSISNPQASPPMDFRYFLTVTSDRGCVDTSSVLVKLLKNLVIPNIFSPNGDGINDRWVIEYLESYPGAVVQIYNRYGQMVQRYVNYITPWDGKINGKDAPVGTYYYVIDPKSGRKPITGFVDIIR